MAAIRSHIRAGSFAPFKAVFTKRQAPARFRAAEAGAGVGVGGTEEALGSAAKRRRVGGAKSEAKEC